MCFKAMPFLFLVCQVLCLVYLSVNSFYGEIILVCALNIILSDFFSILRHN
jgi:hypothetical protein